MRISTSATPTNFLKQLSLAGLLIMLATGTVGTAPAQAAIETFVNRVPIQVAPYEVKQEFKLSIPTPAVDGRFGPEGTASVVAMEADIVNADGSQVPIRRLMLHHLVFLNLGPTVGSRHDATCNTFLNLDNATKLPAVAERFYALGEERAKLAFPPGYGYGMTSKDMWAMVFMVMNHRKATDQAFIEYRVTYATGADHGANKLTRLIWMDIENCKADPIYNVPGGERSGSTASRSYDWTAPESGRLVAGMGHVHGGAQRLAIQQPDCGNRTVFVSKPTWGNPDHPFYNVKPILHEPGPINMSAFLSVPGIPVAKGQKLRLVSDYDGALPHTRVMGIMGLSFVPDPSVTSEVACGALPELQEFGSLVGGRSSAPKFKVPLVTRPKGKFKRVRKNTVRVTGQFFRRGRILLRAGERLKWKFDSGNAFTALHNITVANGPEGFGSPNLNGGRSYSQKFTRPGKYQLFCGLHPVAMTQEVLVKKR